ncbi:MAG: glycosyltransferase family 4 protein [Acidimicrobiia bacterium]|nr:glycosyltransferase family 4 protein [Acidimicrobiia bacterium]
MKDKLGVLVVGQTPPPWGGQAVIIQNLLDGDYDRIVLHHVRMEFSESLSQARKLAVGKILHLFELIAKVLWARVRTRATVLYYPPSGPSRLPVFRDLVVLPAIRWAFPHTVFHFHAGGISEHYITLSRPLRFLARRAYFHPDLAISSSDLNPPDAEFVRAERTEIIPLGVADHAGDGALHPHRGQGRPKILFVGFLIESKGIFTLLDGAAELHKRGLDFEVWLMGEFESDGLRDRFLAAARDAGIADRVIHLGIRTGDAKFQTYADADIFCFPSHFDSETFGVVLLEAMEFSLPVVTTRWRGIPSVVAEDETALLVPIKDGVALADALQRLLEDPALRDKLGEAGRARFLERYEEKRFLRAMEQAFVDAAS